MKNNQIKQTDGAAQWADSVWSSIEGIERAKANPFLFTRIQAKLNAKDGGWEKAASWVSRPVFAVAATLLFLTINVFVAYKGQEEKRIVLTRPTTEQLLATEFSPEVQYTLLELNDDK